MFKSDNISICFLSIDQLELNKIAKYYLYFRDKKQRDLQEFPNFEILSIKQCLIASFKATAKKHDFIGFSVRQRTESGHYKEFSGTVRHSGRWIESALFLYDSQFSVIYTCSLGYTPQNKDSKTINVNSLKVSSCIVPFMKVRILSKFDAFRGKIAKTKKPNWNIGVLFKQNTNDSKWTYIHAGNHDYKLLADPFAFQYRGKKFVFCEAVKEDKGLIALFELTENGLIFDSEVLEQPTHLSFPQILEMNEKFYMLPETSDSSRIDLYSTESFPKNWKYSRTLVKNVDAVDSLVIEVEGEFWILTCLNLGIIKNNHMMQWLFRVNPIDEFKTESMRLNPTQMEGTKVRNGGLLNIDGSTIRVAQTPAFGIYGKNITLNAVRHISEIGYFEDRIKSSNFPNDFKYSQVHHISGSENFFAFDYITEKAENSSI